MIEIKDNTIVITLENGTEEKWKILFYYHNDERGKDYYLIYRDEDPDNIIVMASSDGETISSVTDEEFAEAEEMLMTYEEDPSIQGLK